MTSPIETKDVWSSECIENIWVFIGPDELELNHLSFSLVRLLVEKVENGSYLLITLTVI